MDKQVEYFHHPFDPNANNIVNGSFMCSHCGCPWNDEKHSDWQGNKIPMENVHTIIVTEDGKIKRIK